MLRGGALQEGDRVVVGDVFDGGFFIGEDDALAVVAPTGYGIASVDPAPDESSADAVEWSGREDFSDGRPHVVATPEAGTATAGSDGPGTGGGDGGPGDGDGAGDDGVLPIAVGVALLTAVVLVAAAVRADLIALPAGAFGGRPTTDDAGDPDGGDGAGAGAGASPAAGSGGGYADTEPELLSDEDRVRNLLSDSGGRMKQSAIVEELGWSKSKTSRVLSRMAEEGTVEKLRLGRENVIDLVDERD